MYIQENYHLEEEGIAATCFTGFADEEYTIPVLSHGVYFILGTTNSNLPFKSRFKN